MKDKAEVEAAHRRHLHRRVSAHRGGLHAQVRHRRQLTDTTGAKARWWVDDQARYCREWLDGKLKRQHRLHEPRLEDGQVALSRRQEEVGRGIVTQNDRTRPERACDC